MISPWAPRYFHHHIRSLHPYRESWLFIYMLSSRLSNTRLHVKWRDWNRPLRYKHYFLARDVLLSGVGVENFRQLKRHRAQTESTIGSASGWRGRSDIVLIVHCFCFFDIVLDTSLRLSLLCRLFIGLLDTLKWYSIDIFIHLVPFIMFRTLLAVSLLSLAMIVSSENAAAPRVKVNNF